MSRLLPLRSPASLDRDPGRRRGGETTRRSRRSPVAPASTLPGSLPSALSRAASQGFADFGKRAFSVWQGPTGSLRALIDAPAPGWIEVARCDGRSRTVELVTAEESQP